MPEPTDPAPDETFVPRPAVERADALPYRLRQQALLGAFGRAALAMRDLDALLQHAAELCAQGLEAPFCTILEYLPHENRLLMRAGVGWEAGSVDRASLGADLASPAGFAYHTGQAVLSNHLAAEDRFRTPDLMARHGIRRAVNVLIARSGEAREAFGVLEVDSPHEGQFDRADADFLATFAGLLGIAIERHQADARLAAAMEHQALLTREMSHRVKNSLGVVAGLLRLQARESRDDALRHALEDAGARVATVAEVHDHLWRSSAVGLVELSDFMGELVRKLRETAPGHTLTCEADTCVIPADRAIPLGLLVNELVTNAMNYAYPSGHGEIAVRVAVDEAHVRVEVTDRGVGLPADFDLAAARPSLGLKMIRNLARQLEGELEARAEDPGAPLPGAHFLFAMPRDVRTAV